MPKHSLFNRSIVVVAVCVAGCSRTDAERSNTNPPVPFPIQVGDSVAYMSSSGLRTLTLFRGKEPAGFKVTEVTNSHLKIDLNEGDIIQAVPWHAIDVYREFKE